MRSACSWVDVLSVIGNIDRRLEDSLGEEVDDRQLEMSTEMLGKDELQWLASLPDELRWTSQPHRPGDPCLAGTGGGAYPVPPESRMRHLADRAVLT